MTTDDAEDPNDTPSDPDDIFGDPIGLWTNRDAFTIDYQPDTVVARNDEKNKLGDMLTPVIGGWIPDNILIYGKKGVGKTVVTKHVLRLLQDRVDVTTVRVDCSGSSYQTAISITNELRENTDSDDLSKTGHAASGVYEKMFDELSGHDAPTLIVLDDIDELGDDDRILYELSRAVENDRLSEDDAVGIIGISNDLNYRDNLDDKVKDSLCEKKLFFTPYSAPELQQILKRRVSVGTRDGAVSEGAIQCAAALASKDHGSARQAITIMREAIAYANKQGATLVEAAHVEAVRDTVDKSQITEMLDTLPDHTVLALLALSFKCDSDHGDGSYRRTTDVYPLYEQCADQTSIGPLSYDRFRGHLDTLVQSGLAAKKERNKGEAGGRFNTYWCKYPYAMVMDAVQEYPELDVPDPMQVS